MKYLLFDFDGVLVKKYNFAEVVANRYGVSAEKLYQFFRTYLPPALVGEGGLIDYMEQEKSKLGWRRTGKELFDALYVEPQEFDKDLLDYITQGLGEAFTYIIATNQDRDRLHSIQEEPVVQEVFQGVYGSCDLGVAKPNIGYFERLYHRLQRDNEPMAKEDILFIDDLEENVASAKAFGIGAFHYQGLEPFKAYIKKGISN